MQQISPASADRIAELRGFALCRRLVRRRGRSRRYLPTAPLGQVGPKLPITPFLDRVAGSLCEELFSPAIGKHFATREDLVPRSRSFNSAGLAAVTACYYLASVNSTASLVIVPFEMAMSLPSAEKR